MTSALQKQLCQRLGINIKFFLAYHLETDGQTKSPNKVMKNYLCAYISHLQDNWIDHLSMAKFAANNHLNASTGLTPFFADNGFHLCTGVESPQSIQENSRKAELLTINKIVKSQ